MNKLERIASVLDVFQLAFPEDVKLAVFDTEKIVADLPGKIINIESHVGEPVEAFKGSVSYRAIQERRLIREERGAELYGVAYISTAVPIVEDGKFLGVLSALVSNQKVSTLKIGAEKLSEAVDRMTASSKKLNEATTDLSRQVEEIYAQSKQILNSIHQSMDVLRQVQHISDQSKLLALNGTIEAARAGEAGKSFSVVASEMRKMADDSKSLSENIKIEMDQIRKAVEQMDQSIGQVVAFARAHSETLREMNDVFDRLADTSEELKKAGNAT